MLAPSEIVGPSDSGMQGTGIETRRSDPGACPTDELIS